MNFVCVLFCVCGAQERPTDTVYMAYRENKKAMGGEFPVEIIYKAIGMRVNRERETQQRE